MNKNSHRRAGWVAALAFAALSASLPMVAWAQAAPPARPTIVLVHGAFAESSSWEGVVRRLQAENYPVIAAANPLRGVRSDATYVGGIVDGVRGPVVLVGHSYGGSVISEAAVGKPNVKALVYVAAFAPEAGETAVGLSGKFPGSTLAPTLDTPVPLAGGGNDLYIKQDKFRDQFAADVPLAAAHLMAATQRPIADAALGEQSTAPAWKAIPSYFVYGTLDKNIPPAALAFMAERAGSVKTVVVDGGSHVVMVSKPDVVADLIIQAAAR